MSLVKCKAMLQVGTRFENGLLGKKAKETRTILLRQMYGGFSRWGKRELTRKSTERAEIKKLLYFKPDELFKVRNPTPVGRITVVGEVLREQRGQLERRL